MIQGIGLVGAGDLKSLMELLKGAGPIKEYERRERPGTDPGQEKYAGIFQRSTGRRFCGGRLRWQWPGCTIS